MLKLPSLVQLARAEEEEGGGSKRRRREAVSTGVQIRFTFTTTVPEGLLLFASGVRSRFRSCQGGYCGANFGLRHPSFSGGKVPENEAWSVPVVYR